MPRRARPQRSSSNQLDRITIVLQNLFILEGKKAGMSVDSLRKILNVQTSLVTKITKQMKQHEG